MSGLTSQIFGSGVRDIHGIVWSLQARSYEAKSNCGSFDCVDRNRDQLRSGWQSLLEDRSCRSTPLEMTSVFMHRWRWIVQLIFETKW